MTGSMMEGMSEMPSKEVRKNSRETVMISPSHFKGHDLIDVRSYFRKSGSDELLPTQKGLALPVDAVPAVIDALIWALGQANDGSDERRVPSAALDKLAKIAWETLKRHGSPVHWDSAEKMILSSTGEEFTKWDLHYVLATRGDLFDRVDNGVYRAK